MTELPRVAVVGMGGFAAEHRSWAGELDGQGVIRHVAQVAPVFHQKRFAADITALRERGVAVYDTLRQLLAAMRDDIDLVTIPTGIHLHRPMTIAALEAGCHVLVEKPASGSIQDTDAMIRAASRLEPQVTVGYQHLYSDDVIQLKNWICDGRFGAVRRVKSFGCWPRGLVYYARNRWAGRYGVDDRWVLDAPHQNAMAHAVNLMCYLGSARVRQSLEPQSIQAELYRCNAIHTADTVSFRMHSSDGVEVFFAASHCTDDDPQTVVIIEAESATISLDYNGGGTITWSDGSTEELPPSGDSPTGVLAGAAALATGALSEPPCPLAVARAQTLCTCGTFESSAVSELPHDLRSDRRDAVVVTGMTEAVMSAFEKAALFSELDLPWAQPGEKISLQDYNYYPTYRLPP